MEEENIDLDRSFKSDLEYIKNDVLAKQPNGSYTKWSRVLKAVTVINTTPAQYIDYWVKQYKSQPDLALEIEKACVDKLVDGCIAAEDMIAMIRKSNDFESEKLRAIEALGGEYNVR